MTLPIDYSPLWISLATTCVATVATFFLGILAAKLMYGVRGSLRAWIDGLLTLPLVLPPTVVGFFLLLLLGVLWPLELCLRELTVETLHKTMRITVIVNARALRFGPAQN